MSTSEAVKWRISNSMPDKGFNAARNRLGRNRRSSAARIDFAYPTILKGDNSSRICESGVWLKRNEDLLKVQAA